MIELARPGRADYVANEELVEAGPRPGGPSLPPPVASYPLPVIRYAVSRYPLTGCDAGG